MVSPTSKTETVGGLKMKGYPVGFGYMGYMPSVKNYILFATEEEYKEIFKELEMEDFT